MDKYLLENEKFPKGDDGKACCEGRTLSGFKFDS